MDKNYDPQLYHFLSEYVSDHKKRLFEQVLLKRTRHLTVVLEDIYQPQNASAVMRSCDGMGIQDVHVIENDNEFTVSEGVTIGADKWLTVHNYNQPGTSNTRACYNSLKERGYTLCATSPHEDDVTIDNLPLEQPIALVFGAELKGLSAYALQQADRFVRIPMYGFSESFNISVSAAICLYELRKRLEESELKWQLSEEEKQKLRLEWTRAAVKEPEMLERYFYDRAAGGTPRQS